MIVELSPEAKEFVLKKKEQAVTISMFLAGGWSGFSYRPAVIAGEPLDKNEYKELFSDDIKVYISRLVKADRAKVNFTQSPFGLSSGLSVTFSWKIVPADF